MVVISTNEDNTSGTSQSLESPEVDSQAEFLKSFKAMIEQLTHDYKSDEQLSRTFSTYKKDDILKYLKTPIASAKELRKASQSMFSGSIHYRKMLLHYALLPLYCYSVYPTDSEITKLSPDKALARYNTVQSFLNSFDIKSEMERAATIALRDGSFFGVVWFDGTKRWLQNVDPDYCDFVSLLEGRWIFAVDMSKIKEKQLVFYPPAFTKMYANYKKTGIKKQEVPPEICFGLKADETVVYPSIPFAGTLPSVIDLENMKNIAEAATLVENYKLVNYIYPTDEQGRPTVDGGITKEIYRQIANALPPQVGLAMSNKELKSISFKDSTAASRMGDIEAAINNFWCNAGMPSALWGNTKITSSSAIRMSLRSDEQLSLSLMSQMGRVFNAILKDTLNVSEFMLHFLPVTVYNQDQYLGSIKEAATLGLPVKSDYYSILEAGGKGMDLKAYFENNVLDLPNKLSPLKSTYTQSGNEGAGRETLPEGEISDEGEKSRDKASTDDKTGGET